MINVALDGPSGAGKSTIARRIAAQFGFLYIDTGAMFRALAWKALQNGINIVAEKAKVIAMLSDTELSICHRQQMQHIYVDKTDVTDLIRTPEISKGASDIAVIHEVRAWILKIERQFAAENDCIMDGRDIGTVVLPDANVKIFLTASVRARAERRYKELIEKGMQISLNQVLRDMEQRDKNDSVRETAPLKKADDAITADTSECSFEESVALIADIIKRKTE